MRENKHLTRILSVRFARDAYAEAEDAARDSPAGDLSTWVRYVILEELRFLRATKEAEAIKTKQTTKA